jgi:hypothetical protein
MPRRLPFSRYPQPLVRLLTQTASIWTPNKAWNSVADFHTLHQASEPVSKLPEGLSTPDLHRLVAHASNIDYLCCDFLQRHLERIHVLRPRHLLNPLYRFQLYAVTKYDPDLAGSSYSIPDTGPPSWIEIQRVLRALWHLLIYFELRTVKPSLRAAPGDDAELQKLEYQGFWKHLPSWEIDEMDGVHESLMVIINCASLRAECATRPWHLPLAPRKWSVQSTWPVPSPQDDEKGSQVGQSYTALQRASPAFNIFPSLSWRGPHKPTQILGGARWPDFRRLGFGVWDLKRMIDLEMMNTPPGLRLKSEEQKSRSPDNLKYTWMSILPSSDDDMEGFIPSIKDL